MKRGHLEYAEGDGRKELDKYFANTSRITEMKKRISRGVVVGFGIRDLGK